MKLLLCIALLLPAAQLSESACFFEKQNTTGTGTCFDTNDGTHHQFGESWMNTNCWDCVCAQKGYECCERYSVPFGVPDECMIIFQIQTCSFQVFMKNDPSVECTVGGAIGK
ncbi:beta-microseminoprotein-like isoform X2 [Leucoraja erinacea]|uniref:beta-microseminoprotein-like isoform X2 n=1 Tax=Leucoraja erinaceus TaxID=7782 RepID=UPI002457B4F2|nr:beta-microseminoprotein-like isoform X2 [Leucoraja erinacea]